MNNQPSLSPIPDHRIVQFQKLVREKWGVDLTMEESQFQAEQFFDLMEMIRKDIHKPIVKPV